VTPPEQTGETDAKAGSGVLLGTRSPASYDRPRCRERATCAPDPGHCERPGGKPCHSTARGCAARLRGAHGSPADHITEEKKSLCGVTTRRRNRRILNGLRHGLDSLAARFFSLGMSGFDLGGLAMLGLPLCRLPLADLPQAFRFPAVALVPAAWLVSAAAPLAQADPRSRSLPPGRTATFSRTLASAHGRCRLPGESSGRVSVRHPPRARSKRE